MPVAYSYVRFSLPSQRLGDSARRQVEAAAEYAALHGLTLDTSMRDEGRSGWKGEHVAPDGHLGRFLQKVRAGAIPSGSTLIVEAMDRLSRQQVATALGQFLDILKAGITIVTLMDKRSYSQQSVNDNPMELQYSIMLMAAANAESANKAKRLAEVWGKKRSKAVAGEQPLSRRACPGWLSWCEAEQRWIVDEAKAATLRRICTMAANGYGVMLIARQLNMEGVSLISNVKRGSGKWAPSGVKYIIASDHLIGRYQPHTGRGGKNRKPVGDAIENYYPVVVPPDLVHRARAALAERRNRGAGRKGTEVANLFAGLARCGDCEGPMAFIRGGGRQRPSYLRCASMLRGAGCSNKSRVHYRRLETAILERVAPAILDTPSKGEEARILADRLAVVRDKAERARAAARRLAEQIAEEDNPPKAVMSMIREKEKEEELLEAEALALTREIDAIHARLPAPEVYEAVRRLTNAATDPTRTSTERTAARMELQGALRSLLDKIVLTGTDHWRVETRGGWAATESDWEDWITLDGMIALAGEMAKGRHQSHQRAVAEIATYVAAEHPKDGADLQKRIRDRGFEAGRPATDT